MRLFTAMAGAAALFLVASCAEKAPPPACPGWGMLQDQATITAFRDGPGRDITDIQYKARIVAPPGECEYFLDEKRMVLSFTVVFDIEPGPTADAAQIRIPYFVAIVRKGNVLIDKPGFKENFEAIATLPENRTSFRYQDAPIDIELPIGDDLNPRDIEILFGFQLTEDQLNYNRAQLRR
jgi:hypothetical protein